MREGIGGGPERLFPRASLADAVVDAVRRMVRQGRLVPGELYSVQQLSDVLGVSRSPVREGLLKLAEAGMVSFERNRGFRVALPDGRDIAEIFAVRLALEPGAADRVAARVAAGAGAAVVRDLEATLAAMHAAAAAGDDAGYWGHDRRLHELVLAAAGNRRAARIVDELRRATWLLGGRTTAARALTEVAAEHGPVVAAIAAGDPAAARAAMRDHLTRTGRLLVAQALGRPAAGDDAAADPALTAAVDAVWRATT